MSWQGEPGPYGAMTERELVEHLVELLCGALARNELIDQGDGVNPEVPVDIYGIRQAIYALQNYHALLTKPIQELMPTGFFRSSFLKKKVDGVGKAHVRPELGKVGDDQPK